ncbi:hypothetical protein VTL71DRAFT_14682 [Oculimacula yallundae]|uniref:N-acetyltransferase domain-containing protein n=1 Tax=Oculimacula yallundae TaxID=86028 RepID=A0ABR4CJV4_9HELO
MPLKLSELQIEDFETMINHANLYLPGENLIGMPTPLCWKVSSKLEAQERLRFHMAQQKRRFLGDRTAKYLKITDDESEEIISLARWHFYPNGYVYAKEIDWEVHNPVEGMPFPQGMNIELHNFILRERDGERRNWMVENEPCWILMHLVTRESQRGRGAAGMLVSWGVEKARADDVPVYLEAAPLARPMYQKYGFQQIGEPFMLDLRPHGVDLDNFIAKMGILPTKSELPVPEC